MGPVLDLWECYSSVTVVVTELILPREGGWYFYLSIYEQKMENTARNNSHPVYVGGLCAQIKPVLLVETLAFSSSATLPYGAKHGFAFDFLNGKTSNQLRD